DELTLEVRVGAQGRRIAERRQVDVGPAALEMPADAVAAEGDDAEAALTDAVDADAVTLGVAEHRRVGLLVHEARDTGGVRGCLAGAVVADLEEVGVAA